MAKGRAARLAVAMGFLLLCTGVHAKVATISLQELARYSDIILVGEVEGVELKGGVKVALVRVGSVHKGRVEGPIAFVAEPTWTCDISSAKPGEPVLLYLNSLVLPKVRRTEGPDLVAAQTACKKEGVQLYLLGHSGRGRIELSLEKGRWVAPVTTGEGKGPGLNVNLYVPTPVPTVATASGKRAILLAELIQRSINPLDRRSKLYRLSLTLGSKRSCDSASPRRPGPIPRQSRGGAAPCCRSSLRHGFG